MFSGAHKKKRQVSYRGASKPVKSREEILRSAEQKRGERDAQRRREEAVALLQRWIRQIQHGRASREDAHVQWSGMGGHEVYQYVRATCLLFDASDGGARARLDRVLKKLREIGLQNYVREFPPFLGEKDGGRAMEDEQGEERVQEKMKMQVRVHLAVLCRVCALAYCKTFATRYLEAVSLFVISGCLTSEVKLGVLSRTFEGFASALSTSACSAADIELVAHLVSSIHAGDGEAGWALLVRHVLSLRHHDNGALSVWDARRLAKALSHSLLGDFDPPQLSGSEALRVLDTIGPLIEWMSQKLRMEEARMMLLPLLRTGTAALTVIARSRNENVEENPDTCSTGRALEEEEDAVHSIFSFGQRQVQVESEVEERSLKGFTARVSAVGRVCLPAMRRGSKDDVPLVVQETFLAFASNLINFKCCHREAVEKLAMTTSTARSCWLVLRNSNGLKELETNRKAGNESTAALFQLFCVVYHFLLFAMDDVEFHEQQTYFSIAEVREIVQFLKNLVVRHHALSLNLRFAPDTSDMAVVSIASRLLEQLYTRNCRRPFVPSGFWVAPELDPQKIRVESGELEDTDRTSAAVVTTIPFCLPLESRVSLFINYIQFDQANLPGRMSMDHWTGVFDTGRRIRVRRESVLLDALEALLPLDPTSFRERWTVEFISAEGRIESGIDGGGLFKEFMELVIQEGFSPATGLFVETPGGTGLYPNALSHLIHDRHLDMLYFLGRMLGKCLYESVLVKLPLAPFFCSKILRKENTVNDLFSLDPKLFRNLMMVKHYDGDVSELDLNFTVAHDEMGVVKHVELMRGGKDIAVTNANRVQYIMLQAHYRLNHVIRRQTKAFLAGLYEVVEPTWFRLFNEEELQYVISGKEQPVDIEDLRRNCIYNKYTEQDETIQIFWAVLESFTPEQRRDFLRFVTSTSNSPLMGFESMYPKFCIARAANDEARLPTAATCMNLLKLPPYRSVDTLREKLLYAITSKSGFELS